MPVNLSAPQASSLLPVKGVQLGFAEANIRKQNRKDLLVIQLDEGSKVAGVFTKNQFCAAPVTLCKQHLLESKVIRALVVNTGNANAGTGESGMQHAVKTCEALANLLNLAPNQILPFSTGVVASNCPIICAPDAMVSCRRPIAPIFKSPCIKLLRIKTRRVWMRFMVKSYPISSLRCKALMSRLLMANACSQHARELIIGAAVALSGTRRIHFFLMPCAVGRHVLDLMHKEQVHRDENHSAENISRTAPLAFSQS